MKTLLIIDMQNAFLANPAAPCFDTDGVVERINHAASRIRVEGGKVIFIQHADGEAIPGSDAWQILPALTRLDADGALHKLACDSFADTDLAAQLESSGTTHLYISGFATEFCIDTTVRAAASRGLQITVLSDAHTTANRPHLRAEQIITHHNWVWSCMDVPANAALTTVPTAEAFP